MTHERGAKMLKNIIVLMFVGMVSSATLTASATTAATPKETVQAVSNSLAIVNISKNISTNIQSPNSESSAVRYVVTQGQDNVETRTWLLIAALIGFVMLSNRWSI